MNGFHKIIHIMICMLLPGGMNAQGVKFHDSEWTDVLQKAKAQGKNIFVDIYTSWCMPCKKMAKEVFTDKEVETFMNDNFVCIQLDAEKNASHKAIKNNPPKAYPSYYWFSSDGTLLSVKTGYFPPKEFIEQNKAALKENIGKEYKAAMQRWLSGERSAGFVKEFLFRYVAELNRDSVRPYMNKYLSELTPEQRAEKHVGELAIRFVHSIKDDLIWKTIVTNTPKYLEYFGEDFGRTIYMNLVRIPCIDRKQNAAQYATDMACIDNNDYPMKEMFSQLRDMEVKLGNHEYAEAMKTALKIGNENEEIYPYIYNNVLYSLIINDFFIEKYTPTEEESTLVTKLADKAFNLTPSQCSLMYLAAAYARVGRYKEAYNTLASLPFYKAPVLSSAVYSLLNLKRIQPSGK